MLKKLSSLSDERLSYYLARVREIAQLGDQAALIEVDKLIWEFAAEDLDPDDDASTFPMEGGLVSRTISYNISDARDWERERAENELKELTRRVDLAQNMLKRNTPMEMWASSSLRKMASTLGQYWSEALQTELKGKIQALKNEAIKLADELDVMMQTQALETALKAPISNSSAVGSILNQITNAVAFLSEKGHLTPDLKSKAREGQERAAWYRARKKLDEAEVAAGGGSESRAAKLKREAAVLLAQDWVRAFPDEDPPEI
jgi:hypothetical protein